MTSATLPWQELLEKNLMLTQEDWTNIFRDWSGNQRDTECGIRTRIHTDRQIGPASWICDIIFIIEQLRTLIIPEDVDSSRDESEQPK